jgi:hypothetical protein
MLIALQRAGHLDRSELVRLQARYLNEAKQRSPHECPPSRAAQRRTRHAGPGAR